MLLKDSSGKAASLQGSIKCHISHLYHSPRLPIDGKERGRGVLLLGTWSICQPKGKEHLNLNEQRLSANVHASPWINSLQMRHLLEQSIIFSFCDSSYLNLLVVTLRFCLASLLSCEFYDSESCSPLFSAHRLFPFFSSKHARHDEAAHSIANDESGFQF